MNARRYCALMPPTGAWVGLLLLALALAQGCQGRLGGLMGFGKGKAEEGATDKPPAQAHRPLPTPFQEAPAQTPVAGEAPILRPGNPSAWGEGARMVERGSVAVRLPAKARTRHDARLGFAQKLLARARGVR